MWPLALPAIRSPFAGIRAIDTAPKANIPIPSEKSNTTRDAPQLDDLPAADVTG